MGRIGADGRGDVCPVDAVVAADADPAVADRAVRAGWDFHFRMVRIDPCRIDFHIDDFSSADRRRRVRLAWSDRVHADAHVSLIERQEAAGKVNFYALVFKGRLLLSFLFGRFCLGLCLGRRDFDLDRRFFFRLCLHCLCGRRAGCDRNNGSRRLLPLTGCRSLGLNPDDGRERDHDRCGQNDFLQQCNFPFL